jgi:AcrR family transcriptional regulator
MPPLARRPRRPRPQRRLARAQKGPAPRRLLVDERRQQLLQLGLEAFSERPYDQVSIDDVAHAAGISKGLLYHYFPTKKDFYVATVREGARRMLEIVVDPGPLMPPSERLARGLDAYLDYVDEHGTAYAALLRSGVGADPEAARVVDDTREEFLRRLIAGVALAVPPPLLRATLRGWIGFVEAASLDWVERRDVPRAELRNLLLEVLIQAVNRVIPVI